MPRLLKLTRFGNPMLRQKQTELTPEQILSSDIQALIANIRYTNETKKYGVGLAAPQIGVGVALSLIGIKPTPSRPNLERFEQVIINPATKVLDAERVCGKAARVAGAARIYCMEKHCAIKLFRQPGMMSALSITTKN